MNKVVDLLPYKHRQWASQYVEVYDAAQGDIKAANTWARDNIPEHCKLHVRAEVETIFKERGA